jgi:hypothetical protein
VPKINFISQVGEEIRKQVTFEQDGLQLTLGRKPEPKKQEEVKILLEDREPIRSYISHGQIQGNVYDPIEPYKSSEAYSLKSVDIRLSPLEYQDAINSCLNSLLNECMTYARCRDNPSNLKKLQDVMKILAFAFCNELDMPTVDHP